MVFGLIKGGLLVGAIVDIALQIDKNLLFHEEDASFGSVGGLNVSLTTLCLIALYAIWLMEAAQSNASPKTLPMLGLPAVIYLLAIGLSMFAAQNRLLSLFEMNLLFQAYLLFVYLANHLVRHEDVTLVMGVLATVLLLQAICVFIGHVRGASLHAGPITVFFDGAYASLSAGDLDGSPEVSRAGGTIGSPVTAGSFMALLFVPVGSLLLTPASRGLKALALAAILLAAPAIVLTGTRGAVLTVGISSLLFAWFTWRRGWLPRRAVVLGLTLAILTAAPLAELVWARVVQGDGGSAIARVHLSKIAVAMIQDHLLFGVGAGNCYRAMLPYANSGEFRAEWLYTVHSKFLLVWVETGLFGLLAFLSFLFTMLGQGWAAWHSDTRLIAILSLAFAVALLGQLPHMAMDVFNSRPQVQMLWCCAGIVAALYRIDGFAALRDVRVGELGHVV